MAKKAAKKAGRPPKDKSERLGTPVTTWLSGDQNDLLDRASELSGMARSEFMRQAIVEKAQQVIDAK